MPLLYVGVELCLWLFGGDTWGRRLFGRPRPRWDHHIKLDIEEIGWCVDID